jgi:hypothetical protein
MHTNKPSNTNLPSQDCSFAHACDPLLHSSVTCFASVTLLASPVVGANVDSPVISDPGILASHEHKCWCCEGHAP